MSILIDALRLPHIFHDSKFASFKNNSSKFEKNKQLKQPKMISEDSFPLSHLLCGSHLVLSPISGAIFLYSSCTISTFSLHPDANPFAELSFSSKFPPSFLLTY